MDRTREGHDYVSLGTREDSDDPIWRWGIYIPEGRFGSPQGKTDEMTGQAPWILCPLRISFSLPSDYRWTFWGPG